VAGSPQYLPFPEMTIPTSLDAVETGSDLERKRSESAVYDLPISGELEFRHSGWRRHRAAIYRAMIENRVPPARLERFAFCGHAAWVYRTSGDNPTYKLKASYCHDRYCLPCQVSRAQQLAATLFSQLPAGRLAFITLTIKHSDRPLADQLDFLTSSFRKLRTSKLWKASCDGGVAFVEVKMSKDRMRWHPHLHIIASASWIPQSDLAAAWHRITKTSFMVDIRPVTDRGKVKRYVTAYASKPMSYAPTNSPHKLQESIAALRGRRLCFTFGSWRTFKLVARPEPELWVPICSLPQLILRAKGGESFAVNVLAKLKKDQQWQLNQTKTKRGPPKSFGE